MDTFPDLGSLTDQELKDLIKQLTDEEMEISYKRRILHGKIDILRAELVNRLRKKHEGGEDVITGDDVQKLTDILAGRAGGEPSTATYRIDETGELVPVDVEEVVAHEGAAVVIRAGGGRVGESFALDHDRMTIGRRPDSDVFLDDVTVSRDHALLVKRGGDYYLDDLGSLNGTYVNRHRIESHRLDDGDELQVGKFKLTYLSQ